MCIFLLCDLSQYTSSLMRHIYYLILVGDFGDVSLFNSSLTLLLLILLDFVRQLAQGHKPMGEVCRSCYAGLIILIVDFILLGV